MLGDSVFQLNDNLLRSFLLFDRFFQHFVDAGSGSCCCLLLPERDDFGQVSCLEGFDEILLGLLLIH